MVNFQLVLSVHKYIEAEILLCYNYAKADFDATTCALISRPFNFSTLSGSAAEAWVDFINLVYIIIHDLFP